MKQKHIFIKTIGDEIYGNIQQMTFARSTIFKPRIMFVWQKLPAFDRQHLFSGVWHIGSVRIFYETGFFYSGVSKSYLLIWLR